MRPLLYILICFVSFQSISQEAEIGEEFLPINMEGKEAFLSTKTGEYVFLDHAETDPAQLKTTQSGVIYTDIKKHTVAKKETISRIAKKYNLTSSEILKQNKLTNSKLSIGQELKIIKKIVVKSSSPIISQGESTIIAKLQPGQTPTGLDAAPPNRAPSVTTNPVRVSNPVVETETVTDKKDEITTDKLDSFYSVKKGDNLYNISKRHGITVETLKKLNNLNSNDLKIGQKLRLN